VLRSKIRQLSRSKETAERSLIAANFGALFQEIRAYVKAFPESSTVLQQDQDREAAIAATMTFLKDNPIVSGVLIWWEQWRLGLDAKAMVYEPRPISLMTPSCEIKLGNGGLAELLRTGKNLK
jgi:hypothetical protein